jgi:hypothetical protein
MYRYIHMWSDLLPISFRLSYETTFSTQFFSSFFTSSLKFSTSRQQSSGRRSFSRRHLMTSLRAVSTPSGSSRTCFLFSSLDRSASTSLDTDCLVKLGAAASSFASSTESLSCASFKAAASLVWSFLSSSATRAWTCSSIRRAREASVYCESASFRLLTGRKYGQ